jgi:hypothetical protein
MKITLEDGTSEELHSLLTSWYADAFKDGDTVTLKYPDGTTATYEFKENWDTKQKSYKIKIEEEG